ncbi:Cation transport protein chaC [Klebsiella pneumoniae]|uniref:Cation transport protein chaC n=1 Tax=Klebsiella pneumoniae TaxID=573 RepID=A0A2X3C5B2_KLEPN|nr:Cation transport protein chaC [Klebsiella pneumoniae]
MLTRDFLMNADCKTAFGAIEESLLWSAEQRAASLAATLACRPDDGSVWIFGYGSLIWNPALNYRESCTGTLPGWHRAFCLRLTAGRGSACQPDACWLSKRAAEPPASPIVCLTTRWRRS